MGDKYDFISEIQDAVLQKSPEKMKEATELAPSTSVEVGLWLFFLSRVESKLLNRRRCFVRS